MRGKIKRKVMDKVCEVEENFLFSEVLKEGDITVEIHSEIDLFKTTELQSYIEEDVMRLERVLGRCDFIEKNEMTFRKNGENTYIVCVKTTYY